MSLCGAASPTSAHKHCHTQENPEPLFGRSLLNMVCTLLGSRSGTTALYISQCSKALHLTAMVPIRAPICTDVASLMGLSDRWFFSRKCHLWNVAIATCCMHEFVCWLRDGCGSLKEIVCSSVGCCLHSEKLYSCRHLKQRKLNIQ